MSQIESSGSRKDENIMPRKQIFHFDRFGKKNNRCIMKTSESCFEAVHNLYEFADSYLTFGC